MIFVNFTKSNSISLIGYRDEFRFVKDGERKSLVVMCDISNLDNFFDLINNKYSLSFNPQPTHVSLFTLQQDKAIFLVDKDDISTLTKIVPKPVNLPVLEF